MNQSIYSDYDDFAWFYNRYWGNLYNNQEFPVVEKLLLPYLASQSRILDLCCGTGQLTQGLIKHGFQVTGIDSSIEMLRYARENAPSAEFILADARSFSLPPIYHSVLSTGNSLNHIMTLEELKDVFKNVYATLQVDGVFLFDVIMEEGWYSWPDSSSIVEDDNVCIWQNNNNSDERMNRANITLFRLESKIWQRLDLTLFQKSYSESDIRSLLTKSGFSNILAYNAIKDLKMDFHTGRVFFLAHKEILST